MALNINTLITRTLTAIVFVAVLLSGILLNFVSFSLLFLVVSTWGLFEFYQLSEKLGAKPYKMLGIASGILLFAYGVYNNSNISLYFCSEKLYLSSIPLIFAIFIAGLFDKKPNTILNISYTVLGIVYAVIPFIFLVNIACFDKSFTQNNVSENWLHNIAPYNYHYVLGIILLIWSCDVSAYLVGSLIGKNKLYERISPGKTWEGSIGATILTIGCAVIVSKWFPELALKHWIMISIMVSVFGTIGDLVESMLKRQAGVKDSGKIMPGHGGILDRFDSLLFVSPFIYCYLKFVIG